MRKYNTILHLQFVMTLAVFFVVFLSACSEKKNEPIKSKKDTVYWSAKDSGYRSITVHDK
jgi:outer membrane biogenesis lipoprotein LolB